jgi:DNA-binding transcriptional regulator YhcF (GntR family)
MPFFIEKIIKSLFGYKEELDNTPFHVYFNLDSKMNLRKVLKNPKKDVIIMKLTEKIYRALFQDILKGRFLPGQKFLTEKEAMQRFGASRITIRRAFAKLVESNAILRKQKVGSIVNTELAASGGKISKIAALLPIENHFARSFLSTLCHEAAKRDVITVLEPGNSGLEQNEAVIRLALHGIRDMVVWGIDRTLDLELFFRLRILGINTVFFDRINPGKLADYVCLDNAGAMRALFEKANARGIRSVYFVDPTGLDVDSTHERLLCCQKECADRNIDFSTELPEIFPEHSAIFAVNDPSALMFAECGVPVFSIDGLPESRARGIISYRQPMDELAKGCFKSLGIQRRLGENWKARQYRFLAQEPFA